VTLTLPTTCDNVQLGATGTPVCSGSSVFRWEKARNTSIVPEGRRLTKWRPPHIPYLRTAIGAISGLSKLAILQGETGRIAELFD
jgi:hypothetical protein